MKLYQCYILPNICNKDKVRNVLNFKKDVDSLKSIKNVIITVSITVLVHDVGFLMRRSLEGSGLYRAALIRGNTVPRTSMLCPQIYMFGYSRSIACGI